MSSDEEITVFASGRFRAFDFEDDEVGAQNRRTEWGKKKRQQQRRRWMTRKIAGRKTKKILLDVGKITVGYVDAVVGTVFWMLV